MNPHARIRKFLKRYRFAEVNGTRDNPPAGTEKPSAVKHPESVGGPRDFNLDRK
jgi:hypothetical protein